MGAYSHSITSASSALPLDQPLLDSFQKDNESELKALDDSPEDAHMTEGESEILDALNARANYLTKIGDKERAVDAQLVLEKTPGLGSRIDIVFTHVRIGLFFGDQDLINTYIAKAETRALLF